MKSTSRVAVGPDANTREPGIRSGRKYKSELKKGEARSGPTSAAVARPLASPLPDRFSADRDGRIRSTGTSVVPRHREAALGSKWPRNRGKSDVQPSPWDNICAGSDSRQFQKVGNPRNPREPVSVLLTEHLNLETFPLSLRRP